MDSSLVHPTAASTTRVIVGAPLRSLQLSQDGHYALINALDGNAWMQGVKGADTRIIPRPDRDNGGSTIKSAIDEGTIPTNRTRATIEAVALSPDARYVVAGYDDGSIGVHPGIKIPEHRPFRADNQFLLADLRFDKNTDIDHDHLVLSSNYMEP